MRADVLEPHLLPSDTSLVLSMSRQVILFFFTLELYLFGHYADALRMIELQVPTSIESGLPVLLNCTYDLEGDILYSIKWYKNNLEFYRYIASEKPPGQIYQLKGIHLSEKFPHGNSIKMHVTDLHSEGSYRCEVTAEDPFFQTVMDEKEMRVYVLPNKDPTIVGSRPRYSIADDLNITCISGPSKPPSFLQWFVNGKEVPQQSITRLPPKKQIDGLLSSQLGLRFVVVPNHLKNGVLTLTCRAYISKANMTTKNEITATNKAKISENRAINEDGPLITGGRLRYQEGNVVNVNCSAVKSHPPAELRWYINDKEANRDYLRPLSPIRYPDGQESTLLGLRFTVQARHFQRGEMRLKCVATHFKVENERKTDLIISSRQESSGLVVIINRSGESDLKTNGTSLWLVLLLTILICIR
ncbi:cell adhesion molecule CEACAM6 isoform X2 [Parasteatoda tepidariorum]|uniref:cell adhesion molecule CEACAM6 isoform X2 n=1 Tax=Parasteatoda tepidariorum TaxID=114398 RepID=UPI001C723B3C|nr:carcinoembryonic antigen-related cell adhesion molecule 6 isoform X2 [Parasteatoda tepidariorum]